MLNIQESELFKALSEEIRLRIMVLLTNSELCVCDLTQVLSIPQSSVSRHMSKLKSSQLIIDRRDGKWVYYRLNDDINSFIPFLSEILNEIKHRQPYQSDREKLTILSETKNC